MQRRQAGVTLVELLVVVAIIGLATSAVVLTLPDDNASLHRQADDFGLRLQHARDEAILKGRAVQVGVDAGGYSFQRRDFGEWLALEEGPFAARRWAAGVVAVLPERRERLSFRFDATGMAEPQRLQLVHNGTRVEIAVDAAGKVKVE